MKWGEINTAFLQRGTEKGCFAIDDKQLFYVSVDPNTKRQTSIKIASGFMRMKAIRRVHSRSGEHFELMLKGGTQNKDIPVLRASITKDFRLVWHKPNLLIWLMQKNHIQIYDSAQVLQAYQIYIEAEIEWHDDHDAFQTLDFGWKPYPQTFEYLGVHTDTTQVAVGKAFLANPSKDFQQALAIVLSFMNSYPQLLPLFGYLFYSLSRKLLELLAIKLPPPFFLAISGRNAQTTPAEIANLILNMFDVNMNRPHAIKRGVNISADSISHHDLLNKIFLHDVTLLVYNKARSLTKTNPCVKTILTEVENIDYYPVFVTKDVLRDDSILTVDIAEVPDVRAFTYDLISVREAISEVVLQFIDDVAGEMSACLQHRPNQRLYVKLTSQYHRFINNESADDDVDYYAALLNSLTLFFSSDSVNQPYHRNTVNFVSKQAFQTLTTLSNCHQLPEKPWEEAFLAYIRAIFVEKKHQVSFEHWEGIERNGKEACYYLSYHAYYADFCTFSDLHIQQKDLQQQLWERQIIKTRTDGKAKGSYLAYNGQALYCLVVLQHPILAADCPKTDEE